MKDCPYMSPTFHFHQTSNRHLEESKSAAGTEVLEEMETITLQPIGRGVHDLEPTGSIARSFRANTPTGKWTESLPAFHRQLGLSRVRFVNGVL